MLRKFTIVLSLIAGSAACSDRENFYEECQISGEVKTHLLDRGFLVHSDRLSNGFPLDREYYIILPVNQNIPLIVCNETSYASVLSALTDSTEIFFNGHSQVYPPNVDYLTIPVAISWIGPADE